LFAVAQSTNALVIWYDRTDGSAYLKNNNPTYTIGIDGYTIASDFDDLVPDDYDGTKGWRAFEDLESQFPAEVGPVTELLGDVALTMQSANPGVGNLTELTLRYPGLQFDPGEMWFIGKPFAGVPIDDAGNNKEGYRFLFKPDDLANYPLPAIIGAPVPEPATWLLAAVAALGLVGARRLKVVAARGLVAAVAAFYCGDVALAVSPLAIQYDADGTTYLWNTTDAPVSFDGYSLDSEDTALDPLGWKSISDQVATDTQHVMTALGPNALSFFEGSQAATSLPELTISGWATLEPHAMFSIGKPFLKKPATRATFHYSLKDDASTVQGDIWVPEPASWFLAAMAGLSLLVLGQRRRAVAPSSR